MSRIHPECPYSIDKLFRREPAEEEDERKTKTTAKRMTMMTTKTTMATRSERALIYFSACLKGEVASPRVLFLDVTGSWRFKYARCAHTLDIAECCEGRCSIEITEVGA